MYNILKNGFHVPFVTQERDFLINLSAQGLVLMETQKTGLQASHIQAVDKNEVIVVYRLSSARTMSTTRGMAWATFGVGSSLNSRIFSTSTAKINTSEGTA